MANKFLIKVVLVSLILTIRCSGKHVHKSRADLSQLCTEELGSAVPGEPSPDGTYVLCRKVISGQKDTGPSVEYVIFKKDPLKIVYKGKIMSGNVVWYSNEEVLITEKLGILGVRKQNTRTFRVNVRTGRITGTEIPEKL